MITTKISQEEFEGIYFSRPKLKEETTEEALQQIWAHEKKARGIDWLEAAKNGPDALKDALNKMQGIIDTQLEKLTHEEMLSAKNMGIIDTEGRVKNISNAFFETLEKGTNSLATFPDGAPSYPVWGWNEERVAKYQKARGGDVKKYITNLVRSFQVMEQSDDVGITKICMEAGIVGFGIVGITAAFNIIRTLAILSEATEAYAVLEGLITVGVNVIKLGISIVILAILIPLMILMAKDALGLFVIVNNTNEDLKMNAITFTHGKCISGFKSDAEADNPKAIVPKIFEIYNPKLDKTIKSIAAGFLGVRKRDNALIGVRGALSFESNKNYPDGVFVGWEVPLAIGDNRLLVSATYKGSVSSFSDKTGDKGALNSTDTSSKNHKVDAHMNSGSGSQAYAFVFVN